MFGDGLADDASLCAAVLMQQTRIGVLLTSLGASGVQLATRTASGAVPGAPAALSCAADQTSRVDHDARDAFVGCCGLR